MALVKEYFDITKTYKKEYGNKTILLMQVGAFFEVYGKEKANNQGNQEEDESQIYDFARICDLNIAEKKSAGSETIIMAGFSLYMIDKYLRKMKDAGYTIVVYVQDETKTSRHLSEIYSPGTYFSLDTNVNSQITNNITCIWVNTFEKQTKEKDVKKFKERQIIVGMSNIDIYTGKSSIFEFQEVYINNPTTFDELERFISIYCPVEIIVIYNVSEKEINDIISFANISQCKLVHKVDLSLLEESNSANKINPMVLRAENSEKQTHQRTVLEKFFSEECSDYDSFSQLFYQTTIATQSFCFLLDFIYQHNPDLVNHIQQPIFENCSDRLILANHSLKQLNIIEDRENGYSGPYSSVEKLLNICLTASGRRKFSYHLLNPSTNTHYLQEEYDIIEYMISNYMQYSFLKPCLSQIKDIAKINRQIVLKRVSPKILFQLHKNLQIICEVREKISFDQSPEQYILENYLKARLHSDEYAYLSKYCCEIASYLEKVFILEDCETIDTLQTFEKNFIQMGVNIELDDKIRLLDESREKLEAIRVYLNESITKYEKGKVSEYVKIYETEKNHFSIVATKRRCAILKQIIDQSASAVSLVQLQYVETTTSITKTFQLDLSKFVFETQSASNDAICSLQIKELCKNISTIKVDMKDMIASVYLEIVKKMEFFSDKLTHISDFISILDVVWAKASVAKKYGYCKPNIASELAPSPAPAIAPLSSLFSLSSFVNAKGLRHCLIEHLQQNELYVSNDIVLGKVNEFKEEKEQEKEDKKEDKKEDNQNKKNGVLLYGTNAVGKTSFIRSIGISIIMAQAGMYVPCSSFEYIPYKYIFTRILGNDNIFKNLSTFAVEMSELRTILQLADKNSLVLGDELCSGTESISAVSIFVAGVQTLYEKQCSFIFATHLHEIIHYDEMKNVSLKHMSVIYDREKNVLVYDRKLKDGPGDNMYGLEVCRSLNLPESFLNLAHSIRIKYNPQFGSLLSLKTSHYNSEKVIGMCEKCQKKRGTEVHHLQHQKDANEDNLIVSKNGQNIFNKNHVANLITLCEDCHHDFHKTVDMHKKVKTSKGSIMGKI